MGNRWAGVLTRHRTGIFAFWKDHPGKAKTGGTNNKGRKTIRRLMKDLEKRKW